MVWKIILVVLVVTAGILIGRYIFPEGKASTPTQTRAPTVVAPTLVAPTRIPVPTPALAPTPSPAPSQKSAGTAPLVLASKKTRPHGLADGDFETPDAGSRWRIYGHAESLGAWIAEGEVDHVGFIWQAARGSQSVDLNGTIPGAISQEFILTPGKTYHLRFAVARNPKVDGTVRKMEVQWNDAVLDTIALNPNGNSPTDMKWEWRERIVVAQEQNRLKFRSLTPGSSGIMLDDVTLPTEEEARMTPLPTPKPTPTPTPKPTLVPTPTPTPTMTPSPTFTPTPVQILKPTPTPVPSGFTRVRGNEIVLLEEVKAGEELMPGALQPRIFALRMGGCECNRALDIQFSPSQGNLRAEVRLDLSGPPSREGQEFPVPRDGRFAFLLIWADPGTLPFVVNRISVTMKEENNVVAETLIAVNLVVAESLSSFLQPYVFDPEKGVVRIFGRVRNLAPKSQTVHDLRIRDCSFPSVGTGRFLQSEKEKDPKQRFEINHDLFFEVRVTVPAGVVPQGILQCRLHFTRVIQRQAYDPQQETLIFPK